MKKLYLFTLLILLPMFANADDSGICGENLTWKYEEATHTLTISGTGAMTNFSYNVFNHCTDEPWFNYSSSIQELIIESGVTTIGEWAFYFCTKLTSVTIPNSVTTIGELAFNNCTGLTSVTIPNSVTTIERDAFFGCTELAAIHISDLEAWCRITFNSNPLMYAHHLFLNGEEIMDLVIPNGVTSIANDAFIWCTSLTSVTIPNSVTSIGYGVFVGCSSLTTVTLPNSIMNINNSVFSHCSSLSSITIPNSVISIGEGAFYECTALTSVTIPNSVTSIGEGAFSNCTALTSVTIPNSVTTIERYAFSHCTSLTYVSIPNSLTSIDDQVFAECSSLTSVTIPNSVTSIGVYAFSFCTSLTSIIIPNSVTTIGGGAFMGCSSLTSVTIPNSVTSLEDQVFAVSGLTSVTIPNSVTRIGSCAFQACRDLTSITIPNSVTSIGDCAFQVCSGLTSITIPNSVTQIEGCAFQGCSGLTNVTLPNSITSIEGAIFYDCTSLTTVTIPDNVTNIGQRAFWGCSNLSSVIIGSGVKEIEMYAFALCPNLLDVYCLAESVPNTDSYAFLESNPENITLHVPITLVDAYQAVKPWSSFKSIVKIEMPKYILTYVVDGEIYQSYQLEEGASIAPESAPTKEGYTFSGWSEIPETMPAHDVTVTGSFTINKYKLTYLVDGEEYKSYEVEYSTTITPEDEPSKEGYTFSGWSEIPETMPAEDVTVTGTFNINSYKLTYIVDGEEYKSFEIEYGSSITPEDEPTKDGYSFSGWSKIPETMPAHDVEVIGTFTQEVYNIDNVTYVITGYDEVTITGGDETGEVTIESSVVINDQTYQVTAIAEDAFKGNQDMTSVTIPEGITTIGNNAFANCTGLILINIGKDVQTIGSRAFANVGTSSAARTRSEESTFVVNCYTESVPYTASDAFENTPIETGTLFVEDNLTNVFKATSPWFRFGKIYGFNETVGINAVTNDTSNALIFDMQGNRLNNIHKGVNIIRTKEGKTKKVIAK